MSEPKNVYAEFEQALAAHGKQVYHLRLFITGASRHSLQAVANVKQICEQYLAGRYELEVIDLHQQPELAAEAQLVVAPTLVKDLPPPVRKLIGTMSNTADVLLRLGLHSA